MSTVSSTNSSTASTAAAASTAASSTTSSGGIANESTFLTLLVAQLQNQDPMNPADSTQFVTQLAQFSSLEQLMNINTNVGNIESVVNPSAASGSSSSSSSGNSSSNSNSAITSLLG
jgi:flagellar basal-body rod modification protein FlgD